MTFSGDYLNASFNCSACKEALPGVFFILIVSSSGAFFNLIIDSSFYTLPCLATAFGTDLRLTYWKANSPLSLDFFGDLYASFGIGFRLPSFSVNSNCYGFLKASFGTYFRLTDLNASSSLKDVIAGSW